MKKTKTDIEKRQRIIARNLQMWATMKNQPIEDVKTTLETYEELLSAVHTDDLEEAFHKAFIEPGRDFRPTAGEIIACVDLARARAREQEAEARNPPKTYPPREPDECLEANGGLLGMSGNWPKRCGCRQHRPDLWCSQHDCNNRSQKFDGNNPEGRDLTRCSVHDITGWHPKPDPPVLPAQSRFTSIAEVVKDRPFEEVFEELAAALLADDGSN